MVLKNMLQENLLFETKIVVSMLGKGMHSSNFLIYSLYYSLPARRVIHFFSYLCPIPRINPFTNVCRNG